MKIASLREWCRLDHFWNSLCAWAEGGWQRLRQGRKVPYKKKPSYRPEIEGLEGRLMPATVVTPADLQGWTIVNQNTACSSFEEGPATPPLGSDSFRMSSGAGDGAGLGGKVYLGTTEGNGALTSLSLSYSTYVSQSQVGHLAPYVNLFTNLGTFVFEPVYQDSPQPVVLNSWQDWNATAGLWWHVPSAFSLKTLGDWSGYLGSTPTIAGTALVVGQSSGGIWANYTGNIDNVQVNGTLYDFEVGPPPATVYVDDNWAGLCDGTDPDGPSGPAIAIGYDAFAKIGDGTEAVASGGTVSVYAGTYNESVDIDKPLSLLGEDRDTTILVPGTAQMGLRIQSSDVLVQDLQINGQGGTTGDAGIHVFNGSNNVQLIHNKILDMPTMGVFMYTSGPISDGIVISDNILSGAGATGDVNGLFIGGNVANITIEDNDISWFDHYGIGPFGGINDLTGTNVISGNSIHDNGRAGIRIAQVTGTLLITENDILSNGLYGPLPRRAGIELRDDGIVDADPENVTIICNYFSGNGPYAVANQETDALLDAAHNYWGSPDGPSGVGPGSGDAVSANVIYEPFLTVPCSPNPPAIAISDVVVTEGDTAIFTVSLSSAFHDAVTVDFLAVEDSAKEGPDFLAAAGTVVFGPYETEKTIEVSIVDDGYVEPDEVFWVNLSNPSGGATIADGQGQGTIEDNDTHTSFYLTTDGTQGTTVSFGDGQVSPQTGNLTVSIPLFHDDGGG